MPSLSDSFHDIRHNAMFSAVVVLTLALGLGATTAVFSSLYATVLKPLPYPDPNQLGAIHNANLGRPATSAFDYSDLNRQHDLFSDVGVYFFQDFTRTGVDHAQKVNDVAMTASMFRTLGVKPLIGRAFMQDEERFQGTRAVLLSEAYWRDAFGAEPGILQRSIELNSEKYRIVGVMPRSFEFPNPVTQMWTPVTFRPKELADRAHPAFYLRMIARLKPGLQFDLASARLGDVSRRLAHDG
jgi:hypothetical protein